MGSATRWLSAVLLTIVGVASLAIAQVKPGDPVDYAVDTMDQYIAVLKHDDIAGAAKLVAPGNDAELVEIYLRGQASLFAQGRTASVIDGWEDGKSAAVIIKRAGAGGPEEYDIACMIYVDGRWKVITEIEDLPTPLTADQHASLEKLKAYARSQIPAN